MSTCLFLIMGMIGTYTKEPLLDKGVFPFFCILFVVCMLQDLNNLMRK